MMNQGSIIFDTEKDKVVRLLNELASVSSSEEAWSKFLEDYSALIYQVIRHFEKEEDSRADCFIYVCEKLCADRFKRLRKFRVEGPASFSTWLRAVVRNLSLDWHRQRFGRYREFQSVADLPTEDRETYHYVYEMGYPAEEAFQLLTGKLPNWTADKMEQSLERLQQALTPRQLLVLQSRQLSFHPVENWASDESTSGINQLSDPAPSPEESSILEQQSRVLARAMSRLSSQDRLLIRLRFEEGLTLQQISQLTGIKDAQTTDRKIKSILEELRKSIK